MLNSFVGSTSQLSRSSLFVTCLGLASLLALSGCGKKIHLDKIPIASMEASLLKRPDIAPYEKSPLLVSFTLPDGKIFGYGRVGPWKSSMEGPQIGHKCGSG